ncbi:MAG: 4-hydroxy-3-methylbut-2-enyl diphosphate reductase [Candidatus Moranbacteria bacterium RIFOXYB1_FULL_43_19]|nr:MAG: 4-hydroxy-3-methylbut-2-enyl diphosphate reductase [Candidatus Moranbacteria bacterium RIFOXYB1_FULL_43_19]OGI33801.1 MAG: 4-hydroxy-3-methylbut-2-enyl diphosphate reductase [Candidatus Moranbacteria bacterium RIFOXYC1_FULL_44_13]OGI38749.1 MAG: 4-hydroxy-3-methylbut-2-enyl diphosphate reductase [Candidatus Moranbacteria bacterium RIFOXYD1_FULL_44_12]
MGNKRKITVGKNSGFCFGVKRAYDLASMNSFDCEKLHMLGKMVHNNDVCAKLKKMGIKEIKRLSDVRDGAIIFTAHGVGPGLYEKANRNGLRIIDTTCPKVMKAQRLAQNFIEKGWCVVIFGDKHHKEVKGIKEWSKNEAITAGCLKNIKKIKLDKKKKYCLISQTTQNVAEFKKIKEYLSKKLPNFLSFNTICDSTDNRQNEIRKLAKKNDAVIVIGGRDSANTKRLFEIANSINPNSYLIENEKGLRKSWFTGAKKIAISAGASTPEWVIRAVIDKIAKID